MIWEIIAGATALIMVLSGIHLFTHQYEIVFYPTRHTLPSVEEITQTFQLPFELKEVSIFTNDNNTVYLYACLKEEPSKHITLLLFQSNAGSVLDRMEMAKKYYELCNVNFVIAVYRGFDKSTGIPEEVTMNNDVEKYFDSLESLGVDMNNIVVIGRSIGASMALKLYNKKNCKGLIIENGFTTLLDVGKILMPAISFFPWLIKDKWDNLNEIKHVQKGKRILFCSSGQDEMVPPSMMQHLYDVAHETGKKVRMEKFAKGFHMNLPSYPEYFKKLNKFFEELTKETMEEGIIENQEVQ
ncbi:hypothetical protein EHI8A_095270 [Entamoeba histolytica HM-1:IMSS-B]|uniref:Protein bem46 n=6 Tax=Entamoeba histolytica TaxID=5759 RepID=B1N449_ENTH1|nr:hypothetical protein EHI_037210 [Entamoeba histolytica HM-1:IMSS]EMD44795.1 protein bem46 [Entamoeba histolytica KU27]EMH76667.1 hypothetical protein EHI8A_095270 [Entamoeba histolytica HM-1:IMSS-B]EMS16238.1 protein bem46, putative [Entamoeba histolytica HM-3:IMSS]ENY64323.1 protein bem46, putative [Entamoeba histolytica HM-1:IMSS-A]GAT97561.1 hypothetical protein CL6EHI_037210 [Entamoeba histolytica]|eukprot:XP_001913966.1 hypothetical protein EHI_037210 [Entamoeba histolytica HM-1:IMSS]